MEEILDATSPLPSSTTPDEIKKLKICVHTLSKELEDEKQRSASIEWLLKQNKDNDDKVKNLEVQLYHWKNSANDAMDRLSRISQKGPTTSADVFYHQSNQKILEQFAAENQLLVNTLKEYSNAPSPVDLVKKIASLEEMNRSLRVQLELKFKENQSLKKTLNASEGDLKHEVDKRQNKISQLNTELSKLRIYLLQKHAVSEYVKSLFENVKEDIMKKFIKSYKDDEENFLRELETTSDDDLPRFLTEPIVLDATTSTNVQTADAETFMDFTMTLSIPQPMSVDERCDSGVGKSVTDSERKYLDQQQEVIRGYEEKIRIQNDTENKQRDQIFSLIEELEYHKRMFTESENELASWRTALTQTEEENRQFNQENDELKDNIKTLEVQKLNLQKQVPFHVSTVNLLKENEDLKATVKTLEEVNHNLHHIISSGSYGKKQTGKRHVKNFSSDTQVGQARPSEYPRPPKNNQEYLRCMQMQKDPIPEPWQSVNWSSPHKQTAIAADGPSHVRDSYALSPTNQQKKQETGIRQNSKQEILAKGKSSPSESSTSDVSRSLQDDMSQCRTCGKRYPSSLIWDHIKICTPESDD